MVIGFSMGFFQARRQFSFPWLKSSPPATPSAIASVSAAFPLNFIAAAVEKVGPTVVKIDASREVFHGSRSWESPWLDSFVEEQQSQWQDGTGSGFLLSADGQVITNAHVVEGVETVRVTLKDGQIYQGVVVGVDDVTDIAVVKIDGDNLPTAVLGDSQRLQPGEWAIAIGNPLGLDNTVTVGIVSAINRSSSQVGIPDKKVSFIQTDAAINPGNSGGPLLNAQGEVIGINTAIRENAQGLGFAIPIETAQQVAHQLFNSGEAAHPFLGIHMLSLTPENYAAVAKDMNLSPERSPQKGVMVVRVIPNSPAELAGLEPGDLIQEMEGKTILSATDVQEQVKNSLIGEALTMTILRDGQTQLIKVIPSKFPSNV